jgi:hypothetical protein
MPWAVNFGMLHNAYWLIQFQTCRVLGALWLSTKEYKTGSSNLIKERDWMFTLNDSRELQTQVITIVSLF